ncbi:MAG: histone deacetylase [Acidobacteriota bacterium]
MNVFFTDVFVLPLPEGHRFPIDKYALLRQRVAGSGLLAAGQLRIPMPATDEDLGRAHDREYVRRVYEGKLTSAEIRRIGFPWSPGLAERCRRSAGATIEASRSALAEGIGVSLSGGTHHAFRDRGEGYCVFNDTAVAARAMQAEGRARRVLVVDADVHQGNGTAAIFSSDPSVFTLSIHGEKNFPFRKESSDLDVALPDGTADEPYLSALEEALARCQTLFEPDLAVYLAGADPYAEDRLGRLALSRQGLARRDRLVLETLRSRGVPVAVTMAGGYARDVRDTVEIHFQTVAIAAEFAGRSAAEAAARRREASR